LLRLTMARFGPEAEALQVHALGDGAGGG
jgi:hypothetical protein